MAPSGPDGPLDFVAVSLGHRPIGQFAARPYPNRVGRPPSLGAERISVQLSRAGDGDGRNDPDVVGRPLGAEIGLRVQERSKVLGIEGRAALHLDGSHHLIARPWIGHGVDNRPGHLRMAADNGLDGARGEVLAVDT